MTTAELATAVCARLAHNYGPAADAGAAMQIQRELGSALAAAAAIEREECAKIAEVHAEADRRKGAALARISWDDDKDDVEQTYEDFAITAESIATAIRKRSNP